MKKSEHTTQAKLSLHAMNGYITAVSAFLSEFKENHPEEANGDIFRVAEKASSLIKSELRLVRAILITDDKEVADEDSTSGGHFLMQKIGFKESSSKNI